MHTIPAWLQLAFSDWITGRLYVDGKLVGGCDIVRAMHARGELQPLLAGK